MNIIQDVQFVGSFPDVDKCPGNGYPEYAFIGRSNVGKSSLVNMLTGRKDIARISKQPGKTQHINYYAVNERWFLVDLPGYGYAKVSKKLRAQWDKMIRNYLRKRMLLQCTFVLIDANVSPQKIDIEFINWLGEAGIPFVLCYTKIDRLKPEEEKANIKAFQDALLQNWNSLPPEFKTSSVLRKGREDILGFIDSVNEQFFENVL